MKRYRTRVSGNQSGFTLVEVLIGIFLLAIGAAIVAGVYPVAQISRVKAVYSTFATSLAEQKMEELKSAGYASIQAGSPITTAVVELPNGQQTVAITQYSPSIKKVSITITWNGYRTVGGSITLATLISNHS